VDRAGKVVRVEFAILSDIDENEFVTAIKTGLDLANIGFADTLLRVLDNFQKARWMLRHNVKVSG